MAVVTLQPPAGGSVSGGWTVVGAATVGDALGDADLSTYVQSPTLGTEWTGLVVVPFDDLDAIPGDHAIRAIRFAYRPAVAGADPTDAVSWRIRQMYDATPIAVAEFTRTAAEWGDPSETYLVGPWSPGKPGGGPWTVADLDRLSVEYTARRGTGSDPRARVHDLRLEVETNGPPSVTVTGPSGTVTGTARPAAAWTYTDPDGDPQGAYDARIYRAPSGGWPTLPTLPDPALLAAGSGIVFSGATGWSPTVDLDNGETYRAYVRARQAWSGLVDVWSPWARSDPFTLTLSAPAAPTLTVAADLSDGANVLTVGPGAGGDLAAESLTVDYRDGPDEPWQPVRDGQGLDPAGATVRDREAPLNGTRTYRARALSGAVSSPGTLAVGGLTSTRPAVWISDPADPSLLSARVNVDVARVRTYEGRDTVYRPIDIGISIVESQPTTVADEIELIAHDPASHDLAVRIMQSTRTLHYRDDRRESFYFRWAGDRSRAQQGDRVFDHDRFRATALHVARPAAR